MTMSWKEARKANFKWNQYVKVYVDGELVLGTVQTRDTKQYDGYAVEEMFGYNGVTKVMLVAPEDGEAIEQRSADEEQGAEIKAELEAEIERDMEWYARHDY